MELELLIKLAGGLFLIAGSTLFGRTFGKTYKERVEFLVDFNKRMEILKNEIGFMKGILAEAIESTGESEGLSQKLFMEVQENLRNMEAGEAWEKACDKQLIHINLKKEDIKTVKSLGRLLGISDVEGQLTNIDAISSQLEAQIKAAEEERKKNEPLFKSLGPLIGVGITVFLI